MKNPSTFVLNGLHYINHTVNCRNVSIDREKKQRFSWHAKVGLYGIPAEQEGKYITPMIKEVIH